jgi:hypothetical protein
MTSLEPVALFALGFGSQAMLGGLAAASIPIILHLLNRRKFRETRWAAMQFLLAAIRKNQRRIRLEQLILLAVRTMIILCVVLAMAKPFLESLGALPALAGQRTHRVLVLDGSLSMGTVAEGDSRFDKAKAIARKLVEGTRGGDVISVVLMGDPPRAVVGAPSPNRDAVLKEIGDVKLPHGSTDLTASFDKIAEVLKSSDVHAKEVIFLTDLQAASWRRGGAKAPDEGLKKALARLREYEPSSVVIDLGSANGENRAVVGLDVNAPIVTVGASPLITATVAGFGQGGAREVRVRFIVDDERVNEQVVTVRPGERTPVAFGHTFTTPGDHLVEARIDDDALPLDNHRWLALPVRENIKVLLVDGDSKSEPFASETSYLAQALEPGDGSPGTPSLIKAEVIPDAQLGQRDLAEYDVVLLCNVPQFSPGEVAALDAYLKQGGGVVVFGGDQVVPSNYNRLLYDEGKGILPAEVGPNVGDASKKAESHFNFDPRGFAHPIVEPFRDATDPVQSGLTGVKTWQYHKLKLPKGSSAVVALGFDRGDPAVIEVRRHRGHVFQVATSADAGWTSWPLHNSFPPVMEQIVLQAAAGRRAERNVRVGQPLDQALPAGSAEATATVTTPGDRRLPTKIVADGDVSRLHFEGTEVSGPYLVKAAPPVPLDALFAANPDPAESDPAKLDRVALAEALPGWGFSYFSNWQNLTSDATAVGRRGELHRQLLYAVLVLLLVESVLAWKFGHHS